jgi:hypothetical protein
MYLNLVFHPLLWLVVSRTMVVIEAQKIYNPSGTSDVKYLRHLSADDMETVEKHTTTTTTTTDVFSVDSFSSDVAQDTRSWCSSVRTSPEPDILIYNMIPKTASTTVRTHVELGAKKSVLFFVHNYNLYIDRDLKWDLDTNHEKAKVYKTATMKKLIEARNKNMKLFVAGHISHHISEFGNSTTIEAINSIRECRSRLYSQIQYDFYTCPNAKKFRRIHAKNQTEADEWSQIMMKTEEDPWVCARSIKCLNTTHYGGHGGTGYQMRYLAGTNDIKKHGGNLVEAALNNMHTFDYLKGGYTYIGITERLNETLEVLECLYPSYFQTDRIIKPEKKYNQHDSADVIKEFMNQPSLLEFINNTGCSANDDIVYNEALRQHDAKHYAAMHYPQHCCRTRAPVNTPEPL